MPELFDKTLDAAPIDAASVILVRDTNNNDFDVLLLCRGQSRTVMNKAWVFPGGKVDSDDYAHSTTIQNQLTTSATALLNEPDLEHDHACALFSAACRETKEETGVTISPCALHTWSRWITPNEPAMMKKRFDARFFIAALPQGEVAVHDGEEATDSLWCTPSMALHKYVTGELVLAPPQIMTLLALTQFSSVEACLDAAANTPCYNIKPHAITSEQNRILTFPGDVDHPEKNKKMPGPTRLTWNGKHFEPPDGFAQPFDS